jgi:HAD superfamily hydrolase (TIGR01549 family)
VVFDVGETLIDETTEYNAWADWLGVPRHTFSAVFGGVIGRGKDYQEVFQYFRPGFDLAVERARREQAGVPEYFDARDLYPDVRPCLQVLKEQDYLLGLAGNQTIHAEQLLRDLHLPVDFIGTSSGWTVEKPSEQFFEKVISECGLQPAEIAYVGDRLDNDIQPALGVGMIAVFIRRGPWGLLYGHDPEAKSAHLRLRTLQELPDLLKIFNRANSET